MTDKQAAATQHISVRTLYYSKVVMRYGSPELIEAVTRGEVKVSRAAAVAKGFPPERQLEEAMRKRPPRDGFKALMNAWHAATTDEQERFTFLLMKNIAEVDGRRETT